MIRILLSSVLLVSCASRSATLSAVNRTMHAVSACEFDTDMSHLTFPPSGHRLSTRFTTHYVYFMEIDGARHQVYCLVREDCNAATLQGERESCIDHTRCCDAGAR